jgi:endonuclease VIII
LPEGDAIFRTAATLQRVLAGKTVTRFDSAYPTVTRIAEDHPVVGRTIESVTARGKHLLIEFSGGLILHTHMRMNGSWHVYPAGAAWRRPARDMRVLVGTADASAIGFNVPVAELLTRAELARHRELRALGPDVLGSSFASDEVTRRMRAHDRESIADVLLDQRVVAGIGNIFKSEVLFLARTNPFARVGSLPTAVLVRILDVAIDVMRANAVKRTRYAGIRTTGSIDPAADVWVYGRGGRACRICGTRIEARKTGVDARLTYWCPTCQPARE